MQTRWRRIVATILAVITALLMVAPLPARAADEPASSKDGAGAPPSGLIAIGPGAAQWFKFKYHYDNSQNGRHSKNNREPSEALVILKAADGSRALSFAVQTPGSLAQPKTDKDGKLNGPVGIGSPMSIKVHNLSKSEVQASAERKLADHDGFIQNWETLVWAGSAAASDTYYVIVKNNSDQTQMYKLSVTGPDVSF